VKGGTSIPLRCNKKHGRQVCKWHIRRHEECWSCAACDYDICLACAA
jgi:hypothetical protein